MPIRDYLTNKSVRRLLIFILISAIGIPVAIFLIYRRMADDPNIIVDVIKSEADMVFKNVEQTAIRNGINEWRLNANKAYLVETQKKMVLENPKVEFFMESGNNVFLTARKGILKIDSKDIQVSGDVIVTQDSYTLKTKQLMYKHDKRQLFTKDSVRITGSLFDLIAGSMKVDLTRNQGLFDNGVTGAFNEEYSF
jgi:LPS export ABC transporter protein LptC